MTTKHQLIIKSLHDAQADCSCGKWAYVFTGERTKEEVEIDFNKHLKD